MHGTEMVMWSSLQFLQGKKKICLLTGSDGFLRKSLTCCTLHHHFNKLLKKKMSMLKSHLSGWTVPLRQGLQPLTPALTDRKPLPAWTAWQQHTWIKEKCCTLLVPATWSESHNPVGRVIQSVAVGSCWDSLRKEKNTPGTSRLYRCQCLGESAL